MIVLKDIAKRYEYNWIFKNISHKFLPNTSYALVGNNGSGKSTLLRCIAGMHSINKGTISYTVGDKVIPPEKFYKHYSFSAPGMEIIEDMTMKEFFQFHFHLKPLLPNKSIESIIETIQLKGFENTLIRNFSSGMKQRVKLAQAVYSNVPYVFLDEPCTNLDQKGYDLYHQLIEETKGDRTLIIASNDKREFDFVQEEIDLQLFKQ